MGRKRGYDRKPFESAKPGSSGHDRYVGLYDTMTCSPAWRDLSGNQRDLYRICKSQYMKKGPAKRYPDYKPYDRDEVFSLSWDMVQEDAPQRETTFYRDMKVLEKHGFINVLEHGGYNRVTIYELSDKWKFWRKGAAKMKAKKGG